MEAPEKIYVTDSTFPNYVDFDGSPINTKRIDDGDIEYTRTDAFIEKAAEWLKENLDRYTVMSVYDEVTEIKPKLVKDFKKAMIL